jgi:hypothetical protein
MDDSNKQEIPDFASLAADPEIAALLDFEPVPRKIEVPDGWGPDKQREVIARLCVHGSPNRACDEMGMHRTGLTKLYKSPKSKSFRAAWDEAVALAKRRRKAREAALFVAPGTTPPTLDGRRKLRPPEQTGPLPGQVRNEHGEWEDEASMLARAGEAKDNIRERLLRARRLFLAEISGSAGRRAAFEILTHLPIDWEKAKRLEPQPDEPWKSTNQCQPDMVLTAESGWTMGEAGYGPDKMAELRKALNEFLAEEGRPTVNWDEEDADANFLSPNAGEGSERSEQGEGVPRASPVPRERPGPRLRSL